MNEEKKQENKDFVDKEFAFLLDIPRSDRFGVYAGNWLIMHTAICNGKVEPDSFTGAWDEDAPIITHDNYHERISGFAATIRKIVEQNRFLFLRIFELKFVGEEVRIYTRLGWKKTVYFPGRKISDLPQG